MRTHSPAAPPGLGRVLGVHPLLVSDAAVMSQLRSHLRPLLEGPLVILRRGLVLRVRLLVPRRLVRVRTQVQHQKK